MPQLEHGHPQYGQINRGHPPGLPALGGFLDNRVEALCLHGDSPHYQLGLGELSLQGVIQIQSVGDRYLIEDSQRLITRIIGGTFKKTGSLLPLRPDIHTLARYAPVRVSTLMRSPCPTKSGVLILIPVSTMTSLVAPDTRSPFTPGSA